MFIEFKECLSFANECTVGENAIPFHEQCVLIIDDNGYTSERSRKKSGGETNQKPRPSEIVALVFIERQRNDTKSSHVYASNGNGSKYHMTVPTAFTKSIMTKLDNESGYSCSIMVDFIPNTVEYFENENVMVRNEFKTSHSDCGLALETSLQAFAAVLEEQLDKGVKQSTQRGLAPKIFLSLQLQNGHQHSLGRWTQRRQARPTVNQVLQIETSEKSKAITCTMTSLLRAVVECHQKGSKGICWNGTTPFDIDTHPKTLSEGDVYRKSRIDMRATLLDFITKAAYKQETSRDWILRNVKKTCDELGLNTKGGAWEELIQQLAEVSPEAIGYRLDSGFDGHCDKQNDPFQDMTILSGVVLSKDIIDEKRYPRLASFIQGLGGKSERNFFFSGLLFGRKCVNDHAVKYQRARYLSTNATSPIIRILGKAIMTVDSETNYHAIYESTGTIEGWVAEKMKKLNKKELSTLNSIKSFALSEKIWENVATFDKMVRSKNVL